MQMENVPQGKIVGTQTVELRLNRFLAVLVLLSSAVQLTGCGGGGGGGSSSSGGGGADGGHSGHAASYVSGVETILVTHTIGPSGGVVTVPDTSPVGPITVTIPAGALSKEANISIGYNEGRVENLASGSSAGPAIVLHSDGETEFEQPVTITVFEPDPDNNPIVLMHAGDDGRLQLVTLTDYDSDSKTATFSTWHFSTYPPVKVPIDAAKDAISPFVPERNGFQVKNRTLPPYYPGGMCLGMTLYSSWYFQRNGVASALHGEFMGAVPTFSDPGVMTDGTSKLGQEIIAARAFGSAGDEAAYAKTRRGMVKIGVGFNLLKAAIQALGEPVPVFLIGGKPKEGEDTYSNHAVLAYRTPGEGSSNLRPEPTRPASSIAPIFR